MANTNGQMVVFMKVHGRKTSFMVKVCIHGVMVENTMASMWRIRNKALERIFGQMEENMKVFGIMGNNMEKGSL